MRTEDTGSVWSVRDAKSRLSEILRRARRRGPQYIGSRDQCVIVSRAEWESRTQPEPSLGAWLIANRPGVDLEAPERGSSGRTVPFDEMDA